MLESTRKRGLASLIARPLLAGMLATGAAAPGAALADDLFLRLEGIKGESTDPQHPKAIVLDSYSQGFTNPATGGMANCGAVSASKFVDKSSAALIGAVLTGRQIPTGVITFRKSGPEPFEYYKVTLTNVVIESIFQSDFSPDPARIRESVSMSAARFKVEYTPQKEDGSPGVTVVFAWDCVANKPL